MPMAKPESPEEAKKGKIATIIIGIVCLTIIWVFLYSHYIWASLLSIVVLFFSYGIITVEFMGTDYFVGDKGYAVLGFKYQRDNITKEEVVLFDDISYVFSKETINMEYEGFIYYDKNLETAIKTSLERFIKSRIHGKRYVGTDYSFRIYGKGNDNQLPLLRETKGSYKDENPSDPIHPKDKLAFFINEYSFMKIIELQWTEYFYQAHKDDAQISFAIKSKYDKIHEDAIIFTRSGVIIHGTTYDHKSLVMNSGGISLVGPKKSRIDANNKKKLFIPWTDVGNQKTFQLLFDKYYYGINRFHRMVARFLKSPFISRGAKEMIPFGVWHRCCRQLWRP